MRNAKIKTAETIAVGPAPTTVTYNGAEYPILIDSYKTVKETYADESSYRGNDGLTVGETYRMNLIRVAGEYRELTLDQAGEIFKDRDVAPGEGYVVTLPVGLHIEVTPLVPVSRSSGNASTVNYNWSYRVDARFAGKPIELTSTDLARLKAFTQALPSNLCNNSGLNTY